MKETRDTVWLVEHAQGLGFDLCGVVRAEKFPELENTPDWLERGYAGEMKYLLDPRRSDPRAAMPAVRSVIVCLLNYNTEHALSTDATFVPQGGEPRGWVSRYAWGDDYHEVLGERLEALVAILRQRFPEPFEALAYVDTGPIQERVLAKYAGLGWLGKNTLLLNQTLGSYFFLGVILTTLDLEPTLGAGGLPPSDLCGSCRRCLDACPTQAFVEPYVMDARKCISYLTIELKGSIPTELRPLIGDRIYGCDDCLDACPWNRFAKVSREMAFAMRPEIAAMKLRDYLGLDEDKFRRLFRNSPIKRTKRRGLLRNVCVALGNIGTTDDLPALEKAKGDSEPLIVEHAQWAIHRIKQRAFAGSC